MKNLFIGIVTFFAALSAYSLEIELTSSVKTIKDQAMLNQFIIDSKVMLPPKMINSLGKLNLSFANLNGHKKDLDLPVCMNDLVGMKKEERQVMSEHRNVYGYQTGDTIVLDERLIEEIRLKDNSRKMNCRHQNFYRFAMATLLHEVSHAYSELQTQRTGDKALLYRACLGRTLKDRRNPETDEKCQGLVREYFGRTISGQEEYRVVAGFILGWFSPDSKNKDPMVSPDPYESSKIEEHYAVNMEYFLLDKEYQCRRPALFKYFAHHFSFNPYPEVSCAKKFSLKLASGALFEIDPARVASIDYFLADAGDDFSSKWGHAMYRIVQCAPHRKMVGPDCRFDHAYHIVLSARANVDDVVLSMMKGIFGGYNSQLFAIPLSEVLAEYNEGELRDLVSVPLQLNREEVASFIEAAATNHWGYRGDYKFLTNNCAQESNYLLQVALVKTRPFVTRIHAMTPTGFYAELVKFGLVKKVDKNDPEAKKQSMLFIALHKEMVKSMHQVLQTPADINKEIFLKLVKSQKLQTFADKFMEIQGINEPDADKVKRLGLFSFLTGKVRAIKTRSGQKALMDFLYAISESEKKSAGHDEIKKIFDEQKKIAVGTKLNFGYGIPTEEKLKSLATPAAEKQLSPEEVQAAKKQELKTQKLIFGEMTNDLKQVFLENLAWISFYKNVRQYIYNFKYKRTEQIVKDDLWDKFLTSNNLDELFDYYQQQQLTVGGHI